MSDKKIITVFGATGNQGGAVVQTFLNDPTLKNEWSVRGVTRDVSKDSSKKLAAQGVEVVEADVGNKESVLKAIQGSYAVFAVTNYWDKMDHEAEVEQGKNMADAAKTAGVHHFIWSTLYNVTKLSNGKLPHVYHFDSKATVADYVRELGIPATFFVPGFYMPNIPTGNMRQLPPNNDWAFLLPAPISTQIPLYYPGDTGKFVKAAVLNRSQTLGKNILGATSYSTVEEIIDTFKKVYPETGKTLMFIEPSKEDYVGALTGYGMPEFAAIELYENMRLMPEFGYYGGESLEWTQKLIEASGEKLTTWEEFAKNHVSAWAELK